MYIISYEKCVCFIFLVILAILSCSGFRIDNLAMTDISKKNFHNSHFSSLTNSNANAQLLNRLFSEDHNSGAPSSSSYRHRIRHHRQLRAQQAHNTRRFELNKPSSDVLVSPPTDYFPNERFAQIPSTNINQQQPSPTKPILTRSQRSHGNNNHHHQQRPKKKHHCQDQDISRKAYFAPIVVHARVDSWQNSKRNRSDGVDVPFKAKFKVIERLKTSNLAVVHDLISIVFPKGKITTGCETSIRWRTLTNRSKEYILFLNMVSPHNYTFYGDPELIKSNGNVLDLVKKITNPKFVPKKTEVEKIKWRMETKRGNKRLKLVCRSKGLPIPNISWRRNGTALRDNSNTRINHKKRKSTLVIKKLSKEDWGRYECVVRGVNDRDSRTIDINQDSITTTAPTTTTTASVKSYTECDNRYKKDFCENGGICQYEGTMSEPFCECGPGFAGLRCEEKRSNHSRNSTF